MTKGYHFKCFYCGLIYPANENREIDVAHSKDVCLMDTFNEDIDPIQCFACGTQDAELFSRSQISRKRKMRCITCVEEKKTNRFRKHDIIYGGPPTNLVDAVSSHNITAIERFIQSGSDVNEPRQLTIRDEVQSIWRLVYDEHGNPIPDNEEYQPTTPLKMVVFRISDCCLTPNDLDTFYTIAQRLVEHGAERQSAWEYFTSRYGDTPVDDEHPNSNNSEIENTFAKIARLLVHRA